MKKILITGRNSFIGKSMAGYLQEYQTQYGEEKYRTICISQRDNQWEEHDFSEYDAVLDVTGIATVDRKALSEKQKEEYYRINCQLAWKTAQKAKEAGVKQFIYLSSILVYGEGYSLENTQAITGDMLPNPTNIYGKSKLEAENGLQELEGEGFQVAILRLPFVYGAGCKGGYLTLSRWASRLPVIPSITEPKSMLYIENLCEFLRILIENDEGGVFFPQNATRESVTRLLEEIRLVHGKKTLRCSLLNPIIKWMARMPGRCGAYTRKAFGGAYYDMQMSKIREQYQIVGFEESIRRTEEKERV